MSTPDRAISGEVGYVDDGISPGLPPLRTVSPWPPERHLRGPVCDATRGKLARTVRNCFRDPDLETLDHCCIGAATL